MILPSLRQLEYLVAIADHGSFHAAASATAVSQPGLSSQLQQLESLLDVQLVERSRPRVFLTDAGKEIARRARGILADVGELTDAARVFTKPLAGTLRLGIIPTVAPYLLPRVLPGARRRYPALRFLIHEAQTVELLDLLATGKLDLLLVALEAPLGDVERLALFQDCFYVALPANHRLAQRKAVRQTDLVEEPLLLLEQGHCLSDQVLQLCSAAGATEIGDFRASSLSTLSQMVAGGSGITLLPEVSMAVEARGAGLVTVSFRKPVPFRTIGMVWRRSSPRADEFRLLAKLFAKPPVKA